MTDISKKAWIGLTSLAFVMGLLLFIPVWSIGYWQAWVYIANFFACSSIITIYLMKRDTALLERRVNGGPASEKEKTQKIIQSLAQFAFIAIYLLAAFDHRFGWSHTTLLEVIGGNVLVSVGFYMVLLVFKENTFTSASIEVATDQQVISTGPYAIVRHPMYTGALILLIGTPLALGSWWGILAFIPIAAVIIWRLSDEENFLSKNLAGYPAYCEKVKYRLLPGIF